jgi:sec-independent protein translocase protein TatA
MSLGFSEVLIILAIALLFFGPTRLPGLGKSLGEAIRGFKKGMAEPEKDPTENPPASNDQLEQPSPEATDFKTATRQKNRADE